MDFLRTQKSPIETYMFEKEIADVILGIRCGGRESDSETVSCCDCVIGSLRPIHGTLLLWNTIIQ